MTKTGPVALNCRFSGTLQPTGTQRAAHALFDAIIRSSSRDVELVVYADPEYPGVPEWSQAPGVKLVPICFSAWPRWKAQAWEQISLPGLCRRMRCTVAHHPITTCPVFHRGVRNIVTLHDLNFKKHPEWHSRAFRSVYAVTAEPGLKRADRVVTISDYVLADARRLLGIDPARLRRVYNGNTLADDGARPSDSTQPYVLCVGSLQPHKNLARLILAWRQVRETMPALELRVVGRPQAGFNEVPGLRALLQTPGLKMLGYLDDQGLRDAYANARVFCYPSLEEGFGLPMLEAMACGAPVVASNVSCMPEIAGGHAELVDPLSPEAIATGLRRILNLPAPEREARVAAARDWAGSFTWAEAARQYLDFYRELLAEPAR